MTEVLAILGGGSTLTLAILIVLVTRWGMKAKDSDAASTKREAETKAELTVTRFELTKATETIAVLTKRAETLAEELANEKAKRALGDGLAPDDIDGRMRRLATEAAATGDPPRPDPGAVVPATEPAATGETIAAAVRNLHPIDVLR